MGAQFCASLPEADCFVRALYIPLFEQDRRHPNNTLITRLITRLAIDINYSYNSGVDVSIAEAKNRLPELIRAVEEGEKVVITRHGKPVAQITPRHRHAGRSDWAQCGGAFTSSRVGTGPSLRMSF
jgi:prevent-host-death family protein